MFFSAGTGPQTNPVRHLLAQRQAILWSLVMEVKDRFNHVVGTSAEGVVTFSRVTIELPDGSCFGHQNVSAGTVSRVNPSVSDGQCGSVSPSGEFICRRKSNHPGAHSETLFGVHHDF